MAKPKRVTRKQLLKEPDEFITTTGRIIQWGQQYARQLTIGAAIVAFLLVAVTGYRYYDSWNENKAFSLLDAAVSKYESKMASSDIMLAYESTKGDFENLIRKYDSTVGGQLAMFYFAGISNDAGDSDRAIALYEAGLKYFNSDSAYHNFILSGLGYAYEKKQDVNNAVNCFQKIADGSDPTIKDLALFNLGRLFQQMGDIEKSQAAYERLTAEYTDSIYYQVAREKVREKRNG